ncbi:MAG TPA: hypothetical protein VHC63_12345 [Acidimicrobiales bacterium]|nr:hypothetical protein [Acidimicrobiales bacterium]
MTDQHKAALAAGRAQGKAVREYLDALEATRPKRGRPRTADVVRQQLEALPKAMEHADPVGRLQLIQKRIDLEAELERLEGSTVDIDALEAAFVQVADAYGKAKGISYAAWREIGVDPAVLKRAGITR